MTYYWNVCYLIMWTNLHVIVTVHHFGCLQWTFCCYLAARNNSSMIIATAGFEKERQLHTERRLQSLFYWFCFQINHIFTDIFNVDWMHQNFVSIAIDKSLTSINIYCIVNMRSSDVFFSVSWASAIIWLNWKIKQVFKITLLFEKEASCCHI